MKGGGAFLGSHLLLRLLTLIQRITCTETDVIPLVLVISLVLVVACCCGYYDASVNDPLVREVALIMFICLCVTFLYLNLQSGPEELKRAFIWSK